MNSLVLSGRKKRRPNFSPEFKKSLAQQACGSGVSVSQLAQKNDVNVNMLFKWRRQLMAGLFDPPSQTQVMLPVTIVDAAAMDTPVAKAKRQATAAPLVDVGVARQGVIEIQIADATIRFDDYADMSTLRAVVRMLRT